MARSDGRQRSTAFRIKTDFYSCPFATALRPASTFARAYIANRKAEIELSTSLSLSLAPLGSPDNQCTAPTDRKAWANAIDTLGSGDILLVTRLDRLARSTRDLLNVLATVSDRGAGFRSLADTWADTTIVHGRLMLTVLGGLAEFERELIKARTADGRKRAMECGVHFSRKPKLSQFQVAEALARRGKGEPLADIGRCYGVSHSTISRL